MQNVMHLQVYLLPKEGVNKSEIISGFHIYQSMTTDTVHGSKCLCQMLQMLPWSKQMQKREAQGSAKLYACPLGRSTSHTGSWEHKSLSLSESQREECGQPVHVPQVPGSL